MNAQSIKADAGLILAQQILEEDENKPHGAVSRKNIINFNALIKIERLLPPDLKIDRNSSSSFLGPRVPTICIEDRIHISTVWCWPSLYGEPGRSPGHWAHQPFNGCCFEIGEDIISLFTYLRSGVFLKNCASELNLDQLQRLAPLCQAGEGQQAVLAYIIQKLGIDPEHPKLEIPSVPNGWVQSDWVYPSTEKLGEY